MKTVNLVKALAQDFMIFHLRHQSIFIIPTLHPKKNTVSLLTVNKVFVQIIQILKAFFFISL
jgi:hypothetical protein